MLPRLYTKLFTRVLAIKKPTITHHFTTTRKSIEQQSYFDSRLKIYDNHKFPHYKPTISLSQFATKYASLKQPNQPHS